MYPKFDFIRNLSASVKTVGRWFVYSVDFDFDITEAEILEDLEARA